MFRSRFFVPAMLLALGLWFFGPVLLGGQRFACRDAAHFYGPLFEQARDEWGAGRVPLWNPYELAGVPLAADTTSSVFYPAKLVFALPVGFGRTYALYVVAHVLLAAVASYGLARAWSASREGAALAGLSYAFGGAVLFQYANVVFLVGAAWLPAALWATDRMFIGRRMSYAVALGAVWAMMVLGGDPQMAYHAVLLAGVYALILRSSARKAAIQNRDAADTSFFGRPKRSWHENRLLLLTLASAIGLLLAAVQVLPAVEFARLSTRAVYEVPRSIYELPGYMWRDSVDALGDIERPRRFHDGLLHRRTSNGSHQAARYAFSVGPWRFAEYFWPGVGGRQFPVHRRWLEAIPAERDPWVPSLYMGLLPLLLALAAWRLRGGAARDRWMSWVLILALLAALGVFSPAWCARQLQIVWTSIGGGATTTGDFGVGDPVGGLYWLLGVILPGYVYFRFPAKWLVVASLAIAMLSARGWDTARDGETRPARRVFVVSLVALVVLLLIRPWWDAWLDELPGDPLYGPFDAGGAFLDAVRAFAHTSIVAALAWWLLARRETVHTTWPRLAAVFLTALDLGLANGWLVQTAPTATWQEPSAAASQLARLNDRRESAPPVRIDRAGDSVAAPWQDRSDENRPAEAIRWWRNTLWPKFNLCQRIAVAASRGTLVPFDYQVFLDESLRSADGPACPSGPATGVEGDSSPGLDALGVGYLLRPGNPPGTQIVENRTALPRAWIVHHVQNVPPAARGDPDAVRRLTQRLFCTKDGSRDLGRWALVETIEPLEPKPPSDRRPPNGARSPDPEQRPSGELAESCRIARYESLCVELEVTLAEPGLVVLSDFYYPGWKLEVQQAPNGETTTAEILRTNCIMRGVWLRPGRYRLIYRYRPASFMAGAITSGVGWLLLGALLWRTMRRGKGSPGRQRTLRRQI